MPLTGVFATRSPDRPNAVGLHPVAVKRIVGTRVRIGPIEAIDGTPAIDIKPSLWRPIRRGLGVESANSLKRAISGEKYG